MDRKSTSKKKNRQPSQHHNYSASSRQSVHSGQNTGSHQMVVPIVTQKSSSKRSVDEERGPPCLQDATQSIGSPLELRSKMDEFK